MKRRRRDVYLPPSTSKFYTGIRLSQPGESPLSYHKMFLTAFHSIEVTIAKVFGERH